MSREDPKVNIRLPADLKIKLHALAAENKRSVNAEVVAAIEQAIDSHNRFKIKNDEAYLETGLPISLKTEELLKEISEILSKHGI